MCTAREQKHLIRITGELSPIYIFRRFYRSARYNNTISIAAHTRFRNNLK